MDFQRFVFFIFAIILVYAAARVITVRNPVHAAMHLVLAFFTCAGLWLLLEAEFLAIVLVLVYVGAVMVLFLFVVMMLNLGPESVEQERQWVKWYVWVGPVLLAGILIAELIYILLGERSLLAGNHNVSPTQVAVTLFGPYLLGVELASMVLLAGLIGANRLGRGSTSGREKGKDR